MQMWTGDDRDLPRDEGRRKIAEMQLRIRSMEEAMALHASNLKAEQDKNAVLEGTAASLRAEAKDAVAQRSQLEAALQEARQRTEQAELDVRRLEGRLSDADSVVREQERQLEELSAMRMSHAKLERKAHGLEEQVALEKSRREEAEQRREDIAVLTTNQQGQLAEEGRQRSLAEARLVALQTEAERKQQLYEEEIAMLQAELKRRQDEVGASEIRVVEAHEQAQRRVAAVHDEAASSGRRLKERCETLERRVREYEEASRTLDEAEREKASADGRAREYLRQLAVEKAARHAAESHKFDAEARLAELQREHSRQEAAAKLLATKLEQANLESLTREHAKATGWTTREALAEDLALEKRANALLRAAHHDACAEADGLRALAAVPATVRAVQAKADAVRRAVEQLSAGGEDADGGGGGGAARGSPSVRREPSPSRQKQSHAVSPPQRQMDYAAHGAVFETPSANSSGSQAVVSPAWYPPVRVPSVVPQQPVPQPGAYLSPSGRHTQKGLVLGGAAKSLSLPVPKDVTPAQPQPRRDGTPAAQRPVSQARFPAAAPPPTASGLPQTPDVHRANSILALSATQRTLNVGDDSSDEASSLGNSRRKSAVEAQDVARKNVLKGKAERRRRVAAAAAARAGRRRDVSTPSQDVLLRTINSTYDIPGFDEDGFSFADPYF
eukprot:TRINITY_DN11649_c0_g1_i1.p1 TRINITY_DN11649_c0_g1~~TRINITY_DN11649_c0_g1_i1.p1  ORF type:complete len:696 (+),score=260.65 TRINITY_DN11649_c0_g1_i1:67-2088(+)